MNGKTAVFAALCLVLALPLGARAANEGGWYLGFDAGRAHYAGLIDLTSAFAPAGATTHTSDNDNFFRLTGGYQFNKYWGLELSWVDFGSGEVDVAASGAAVNATVKAHGFVIAGTGTYPFNDQWSVFVRLGVINGHKEVTLSGSGTLAGVTASDSSTDWKTTYGFGVNWAFAPNWKARLGYDQYLNIGNGGKTGEDNINVASLGIVYQF